MLGSMFPKRYDHGDAIHAVPHLSGHSLAFVRAQDTQVDSDLVLFLVDVLLMSCCSQV